jgi:hypothetical protein
MLASSGKWNPRLLPPSPVAGSRPLPRAAVGQSMVTAFDQADPGLGSGGNPPSRSLCAGGPTEPPTCRGSHPGRRGRGRPSVRAPPLATRDSTPPAGPQPVRGRVLVRRHDPKVSYVASCPLCAFNSTARSAVTRCGHALLRTLGRALCGWPGCPSRRGVGPLCGWAGQAPASAAVVEGVVSDVRQDSHVLGIARGRWACDGQPALPRYPVPGCPRMRWGGEEVDAVVVGYAGVSIRGAKRPGGGLVEVCQLDDSRRDKVEQRVAPGLVSHVHDGRFHEDPLQCPLVARRGRDR